MKDLITQNINGATLLKFPYKVVCDAKKKAKIFTDQSQLIGQMLVCQESDITRKRPIIGILSSGFWWKIYLSCFIQKSFITKRSKFQKISLKN